MPALCWFGLTYALRLAPPSESLTSACTTTETWSEALCNRQIANAQSIRETSMHLPEERTLELRC